ncbi:MAG: C1 family peptidase [Blastocatellia bacterium]
MPTNKKYHEQIQAALQSAGAPWQAEATSISVLSDDEKRLRLGFVPGPGDLSLEAREALAVANAAAPEAAAAAIGAPVSFDLRNVSGKNFITSVKDQGSCGSCVSFGSVATVEGTLRFQQNNPNLTIDLSEAHLFYCQARAQGRTCSGSTGGWWVPPALDCFKNTGVTDEACYPYTAGDQNCTGLCSTWQSRVTKITGWHAISNAAQMKEWLSTKGPLVTCLTVYNDFFAYRSGVYRHVVNTVAGGHCVSCVGYDDAGQYWICKNSWGTGWGEGGFFKIAYGECGIDSTMWAVESVVPPATQTHVKLYRYWNPGIGDHFYTTNWAELGAGKYGWGYEGVQCYVDSTQTPGSVPLYRYWNPGIGDHFYTTNWAELGTGKYGWGYEGVQCYVRPTQVAGTVPLYRYWNPGNGDHFYTTNWAELGTGKYGWGFEGIQCYVYTQEASSAAASAGEAASGEAEAVPATFSTTAQTTLEPPPSSFTTGDCGCSDAPSSSFAVNEVSGGDTSASFQTKAESKARARTITIRLDEE